MKFTVNSFMTEVPIIQKPVHWFALQMDWFLYAKDSVMKELIILHIAAFQAF